MTVTAFFTRPSSPFPFSLLATSTSYFHVTSMCSLASALGEIESVDVTVAAENGKRGNPLPSKGQGSRDPTRVAWVAKRRRERERGGRRRKEGEKEGGECRRSSTLIGVEQRRRRRLVPGDKIGALPLPLQPDPLLRDRLRGFSILSGISATPGHGRATSIWANEDETLVPQDLPLSRTPAFSTSNRRRSGARSCPGDKGWLCDDE